MPNTETSPHQNAPALTLPGGRQVNPWLVLVSLMFGFFMSLLDATVVNIAITNIQQDLKADLTTVSWVLNAYSLVFAVLLVTMGRFADQYGRKFMFMTGMVLFSLGSLLCGMAPTIELLIAFRALQAIGSAVLNPISLAMITVVFPREKRGAAIGIWGAMAGLAAALGPIIGGFLVQNFSWHWIFFINLPFCVVGLFMVYLFVPESRDHRASKTVDVLGLITLSAAMFCLVLAIIQGNEWGWFDGRTDGLLSGALVAAVLFYVVETRQAQPIVDFKLFRYRTFVASNLSIFMFSVAMQGAFLILVLYFINAQGYDQLGAAYAMIPLPLASFFVSAASSRLGQRVNLRNLGLIGLSLVAIGFLSLFTLGINAGVFDTSWRCMILGAGMGLCFTTFPNVALSEIPFNRVGVASGVFNTFRQIGFTLGVAILISVFTGQIKDNINGAVGNSSTIVQQSKLPDQLKTGIGQGLKNASNAGVSRGEAGGSSQTFDLTKQVDLSKIPNGESLRPELVRVNEAISAEFKQAVVNSFTSSWLVAAIIAVLGVATGFFGKSPPRRAEAETRPAMAEMG